MWRYCVWLCTACPRRNASRFSHTEHSCHCHNANELRRSMHLMMMMTSTQRVALIANITNFQVLAESGRGSCSLCSSVDSDLEMDPGTSGEDSCGAAAVVCADAAAATYVSDDTEQSMPQNHRAAHHTHTAWQNEYFVLTVGRALQSSAALAARRPLEGPCRLRPLLRLKDLGAQPLWR